MESPAEVVVSGPGSSPRTIRLAGGRATVGRLPDANDIALEPDPEKLVTRVAHCTLERDGGTWFVVDGGSVNGTFVRRGPDRIRVTGRLPLHDGDVVSVLASAAASGGREWFELSFRSSRDSQATRAAPLEPRRDAGCLRYEVGESRLVLVQGAERHELRIRAQAHRLVRHMADRNAEGGGGPALCTHEELMHAVWGDEPMHSREELAKLVWELRKKLEPFGAESLIENERRLGYRLRTCREE